MLNFYAYFIESGENSKYNLVKWRLDNFGKVIEKRDLRIKKIKFNLEDACKLSVDSSEMVGRNYKEQIKFLLGVEWGGKDLQEELGGVAFSSFEGSLSELVEKNKQLKKQLEDLQKLQTKVEILPK